MKQPCVCILASRRNDTLYTGVTSDLVKRVYEHSTDVGGRIYQKVSCAYVGLVRATWNDGIGHRTREAIKEWKRAWKIEINRNAESVLAGFVMANYWLT